MSSFRVNSNQFLRHWLAGSVGIWPVSAAACLTVWIPAGALWALLVHGPIPHAVLDHILRIPVLLLAGAVIGYMLGDWQARLAADYLRWDLSHWARWSALGGACGSAFVWGAGALYGHWLSPEGQLLTAMPLYMFCVSAAQWPIIHRQARASSLWILGNIVAGIVFSRLLFLNQPATVYGWRVLLPIATWIFAALSQGWITGIVLLWLYDRPVDERSHEELARVPVYIESRRVFQDFI